MHCCAEGLALQCLSFSVWFNNLDWTTGFYWSYTILLKPPFLCALGQAIVKGRGPNWNNTPEAFSCFHSGTEVLNSHKVETDHLFREGDTIRHSYCWGRVCNCKKLGKKRQNLLCVLKIEHTFPWSMTSQCTITRVIKTRCECSKLTAKF